MDAQQLDALVTEAWRMLEEATLNGYITLQNGAVVEVGSKKADTLLRTAENLTKHRPMKYKRITTAEDFVAPTTEG